MNEFDSENCVIALLENFSAISETFGAHGVRSAHGLLAKPAEILYHPATAKGMHVIMSTHIQPFRLDATSVAKPIAWCLDGTLGPTSALARRCVR